jgi:pimeloyl-ACP methyl ester carboxylesterase
VDVGGYQLHIRATGEGQMTVILDAGLGDSSLVWATVQHEVAKFARVCSYDRAGLGWSETSPRPRTSQEIARELHALLANAQVPGPYVLVGHSFGGLNVRLFAHDYPHETAGIVLIDASHEDQGARVPPAVEQQWRDTLKRWEMGRRLSPFGIVRLFFNKPNEKYPSSIQPMDVALKSRTSHLATACQEWLSFDQSAAQVRAKSTLPQVPLVVVSAGHEGEKPQPGLSRQDWERFLAVWRVLQADLATASTNSVHVTAAKSGHYVQLDQSDLVVEAIRRVVEAASKNAPIQTIGK